jgi:hypothetical protein
MNFSFSFSALGAVECSDSADRQISDFWPALVLTIGARRHLTLLEQIRQCSESTIAVR